MTLTDEDFQKITDIVEDCLDRNLNQYNESLRELITHCLQSNNQELYDNLATRQRLEEEINNLQSDIMNLKQQIERLEGRIK